MNMDERAAQIERESFVCVRAQTITIIMIHAYAFSLKVGDKKKNNQSNIHTNGDNM